MKDLMRAIVETRAEVKEHRAETQASFKAVHALIDAHHEESQASYADLAEAIHMLSTNTDQQFADARTNTDQQFADVRRDMATKVDLAQAKHEIMDHGDRKVDRVDEKVDKTVDVLQKNKVITPTQAAFVLNV